MREFRGKEIPGQYAELIADAYFGRAEAIIKQRQRIKRKTIEDRRLQYRKIAV